MNFKPDPQPPRQLDMTPLIDVIFQLLIFFLVTTTFISQPGLTIKRPKAAHAGPFQHRGWTIEIPKAMGAAVLFQGKRLNYMQLRSQLKQLFKKEPQTQINIDADQNVEHKSVVEVMDIISGIGFQKIGIVTSPAPVFKPE